MVEVFRSLVKYSFEPKSRDRQAFMHWPDFCHFPNSGLPYRLLVEATEQGELSYVR